MIHRWNKTRQAQADGPHGHVSTWKLSHVLVSKLVVFPAEQGWTCGIQPLGTAADVLPCEIARHERVGTTFKEER